MYIKRRRNDRGTPFGKIIVNCWLGLPPLGRTTIPPGVFSALHEDDDEEEKKNIYNLKEKKEEEGKKNT